MGTVHLWCNILEADLGKGMHVREPIRILYFVCDFLIWCLQLLVYSSKEKKLAKIDLTMKKKYRGFLVSKSSGIRDNL